MNNNYILDYNEVYRINFPDSTTFKFRLLTIKEVTYFNVLLEGGFLPSLLFMKIFLRNATWGAISLPLDLKADT